MRFYYGFQLRQGLINMPGSRRPPRLGMLPDQPFFEHLTAEKHTSLRLFFCSLTVHERCKPLRLNVFYLYYALSGTIGWSC